MLDEIISLVNKFIPDPDTREKLLLALFGLQNNQQNAINNDTSGTSLQRNWRPLLMYLFIGIIFWDYVIYQFLTFYGAHIPYIEMPVDVWKFMMGCVTGYGGLRTFEKVIQIIKGGT